MQFGVLRCQLTMLIACGAANSGMQDIQWKTANEMVAPGGLCTSVAAPPALGAFFFSVLRLPPHPRAAATWALDEYVDLEGCPLTAKKSCIVAMARAMSSVMCQAYTG